ncbi:hypothetical protein DPMN_164668 [Dreissena polymorpha]|uniref:Uncharacterized protein n=1 Tax=Dreissena polymorpha TaxID=45954 RepID=A0A9D4ISJ7_DREPO|nr:hypothetical protein DPMN_164668 [Dreissena polymorpha]
MEWQYISAGLVISPWSGCRYQLVLLFPHGVAVDISWSCYFPMEWLYISAGLVISPWSGSRYQLVLLFPNAVTIDISWSCSFPDGVVVDIS